MKNTITVLVSLGLAVCCQAAFAQTQTKIQAQIQAGIEQAVTEAFSNEGIKKDPKNPNNVILNGRTYEHVSSKPYGSVYKDEKQPDGTVVRKKVKDHGRVDTYVNGNDTIQVAVHRSWRDDGSPNMVGLVAPISSAEQKVYSGKGVTSFKKDGSFLVETYKIGNVNTYELRAKRDTSNPETRADVEGSTYQAAKNTNIRKTFGSSVKPQEPSAPKVDKNSRYLGPEAYWTPKK